MIWAAGNRRIRRVHGFTLVELLVVVAIMGILAGVAAVSLRGLRSPALKGAAAEVASAMKSARQMAIASGRPIYLVMPVTNNPFATNLFRSYALFEEIRPGEQVNQPDQSGNYPTNNDTNSWFFARTDWRILPDGIVFNNFASIGYAPMQGDPFQGVQLGRPEPRILNNTLFFSPTSGQEWRYFLGASNFTIRRPQDPTSTNNALRLNDAAYLGFRPDGRAVFLGSHLQNYRTAALRLAQGFVQNGQIALTDTNNYYYIETDPSTGRIRVRARESYRHQ